MNSSLAVRLRSLGKGSLAMLAAAGIASEVEQKAMGAAAAFVAIKRMGLKPSLNLL
ncbi:TfoX/Sxy family DNA transformation protein [Methylocaldum sp.]|uniref:TfoX/Sxy family DNA transformation protein n=1 Tax=Methylocaldum sp. TaxID=1969727 RepID=UPI002D307C1D|nr:TfoX/Sxy family DNA transformation protein [Methylocaldum sp.]HYE35704.1 TfoX/Sxy family DNA transformation protein [Methylocaldum sp.]